MKNILLLALALLMLTACEKQKQRYLTESPEINAFKASISEYGSGDWETWRTHFSDTAKLYINSPKSISASDLENAQKEMLASFSSYGFQEKGSFVEMVIDNEEETWVNYWANWHGILKDNGKEIDVPVHITAQYVDGKVVEMYDYYDSAPITAAIAEIEANTSKTMVDRKGGGAGTIVAAASDESLKLAKSYDTLIKMFDSPDLATILGQAGAVGGALTTLKLPLDALADGIPYLEKATTGLTTAIDKMSKVSIIRGTVDHKSGTLQTDGTYKDALLMNDGVVQFNKSDKFMKVSDSTMIAGTNVDGNKKLARAITTGGGASIDYNQMASAIVSAMKSATFVATVKPDLLFNGKKY